MTCNNVLILVRIRGTFVFLQICRKSENIYNMDTAMKLFVSILRKNRQSITDQRLNIFKILATQESLTMATILSKAPDIDRSSIYRTIALFEQLGIVDRLHFGFKHRFELSDKFRQHHHHLHCQKCGQIQPIKHDNQLEEAIATVAKQAGFLPTSHVIEVNGICINCRK